MDEIDSYLMDFIPEENKTYLSSYSLCKASENIGDEDILYPVQFLSTLRFPGLPNHELDLKIDIPVILLRNINQSVGLCNGTRLIITQLAPFVIEC